MLPPPKPERGEDPDQSYLKQPRKVELIATENTAGGAGVHIQGLGSYTTDDLTKGPDYFAERFLEQLRGWDGLKGEVEANVGRLQVARNIASALSSVTRQFGEYDREESVVESGDLSIRTGFRHGTRWEDEGWHGEADQQVMRKKIMAAVEKALAPYASNVKQQSVSYGEKGWWSIYVTLK